MYQISLVIQWPFKAYKLAVQKNTYCIKNTFLLLSFHELSVFHTRIILEVLIRQQIRITW